MSRISSYGQSFASRVVGIFERTVFAPIKERLPHPDQDHVVAHFDTAFSANALVPPTILRVIVEPGGHATLSGVATPGSKVAIQSAGRALGQTKATSSGQWHVRLPQALAQGDHRIRSVAVAPDRDQQWPGQEVRIALPQTLTRPLVVLEEAGASELIATPAVYTPDTQALKTQNARHWRTVQADVREDRDRRQIQKERDDWIAAPIFEWLRRSSVAYDQWIVDDLSSGDSGSHYVLRGRDADLEGDDQRSARARRDDDFNNPSSREYARRNLSGDLGERWQMFNVRVREWLRQAQQSYRNNIVEELADGKRVSRDRFVRSESDQDRFQGETSREVEPGLDDDDWRDRRQETETPRSTDSAPQPRDPEPEWPVVRDDTFEWPPLGDIKPDPENEALIRKAEEDAKKARELARKAAEQAEATRQATEELLAEEKRLESGWAARRAAAKKAVREAELKRQVEAAERRAAAAEAELKNQDALALAKKQEADETEARARADAQRKTAEDLAAAASAAADQEFAAGRVQEPPVPQNQDTKSAETDRERQPSATAAAREEFTVADSGVSPRLSIKDSAADAQIEEGSTLGDVDDFDPSVRYVYDMGDGVRPKAKSKRRTAKKRGVRSRKAKRKSRYRKHARKAKGKSRYRKHARKHRAYRKRRVRYRRRARLRRVSRRLHRHVRRFSRLYKFKARRRNRYRRQACARTIFIPRIRWRRR